MCSPWLERHTHSSSVNVFNVSVSIIMCSYGNSSTCTLCFLWRYSFNHFWLKWTYCGPTFVRSSPFTRKLWGYLIWSRSSLPHLIVKVFGHSYLDIFLWILAPRIKRIIQMEFPVHNLDLRCGYASHDDLQSLLFPAVCGSTYITWLLTTLLWLNMLVVEGWLVLLNSFTCFLQ